MKAKSKQHIQQESFYESGGLTLLLFKVQARVNCIDDNDRCRDIKSDLEGVEKTSRNIYAKTTWAEGGTPLDSMEPFNIPNAQAIAFKAGLVEKYLDATVRRHDQPIPDGRKIEVAVSISASEGKNIQYI